MQILYQERYRDFTVKHFHEQLQKRHDDTLGYTATRLALQGAGLVVKQKRRGPHRKRRERRPQPGMLLFRDGSTHCWLHGTGIRHLANAGAAGIAAGRDHDDRGDQCSTVPDEHNAVERRRAGTLSFVHRFPPISQHTRNN